MSTDDKLEALIGTDDPVDLSDLIDFVHEGDEGWGMAPVERLTERGPNQHGVSDRGYRLQPRVLHLRIAGFGTDLAAYWTARERLIALFAPRAEPVRLRRTYAGGRVRQLDVHYLDGLGMSTAEKFGNAQRNVIQLLAPDPLLYDPTLQSVTFGLAGGADAFSVPMSVPLGVGGSTIDQTALIPYLGTFGSSPVVIVRGPITDWRIENVTTAEVLQAVSGASIAGGDEYIIDTSYGAHTVVDLAGARQIANLSDDSDIETFHLAAHPDAPSGVNEIRVTGSGVNTNTQVFIQYYRRYLGQ
ncbi:MAG: phage tail family protein [Anaerolineales bacterium]|nr:phage tail family protein [Anaerolineales bacterium]